MYLTITLIAALAGVVYLILQHSKKTTSSLSYPDLPLPPRVSFLGLVKAGYSATKKGSSFFEELRSIYGDIVWLHVPLFADFALLTSPKFAKKLFGAKEMNLGEGANKLIHFVQPKVFQNQPFFTPLITKAFTMERYSYFVNNTIKVVEDYFRDNWNQEQQTVDLFQNSAQLITLLALRSFMGNDVQGKDLERITFLLHELDFEERTTHLNRFVNCLLPSGKKETELYFEEFTAIVTKYVNKREAENNKEPDFFNHLIETNRLDDGSPNYVKISMVVFATVFAAATNTYATTAWAIAFLSSNPPMLAKFMEDKKAYDDCVALKQDPTLLLMNQTLYSTHVINEAIRICFAALAPRGLLEDSNLDDEFTVPKGWVAAYPYGLTLHNKDIYSDPYTFNPERFFTEGKGKYDVLTFGAGRHPCAGTKFTIMNVKVALYKFFENYTCTIDGSVYDYIPKGQIIGVFRPARPCMAHLERIKKL